MMSTTTLPTPAATSRRPFSASPQFKLGMAALLAYSLYAMSQLNFSLERLAVGMGNGQRFLARMFPPNFIQTDVLLTGFIESMQIAVLATFVGVLLSLPVAVLGARNLMPSWATWPARFIVTFCRAFNPVIVAIIFVKAIGFGALAGIAALVVASIGFVGKLFMESIEEISMKQIEAVRATGASFMSVIVFGVMPQVMGRFVGFCTYQLDSNLRNSTMVGIVGAGGIGGTLFSAFQRFDYDFVLAIILIIVAIVMSGELLANFVKKVLNVQK
jgi:phosphonate transport system permease protein